jgi:uncharacterized protein (TIRG00374 family)
MKKTFKIVLPIALGVFLVWYLFLSTTPEQRLEIIEHIKNADPFWVGVSILIGLLSHLSRAIRWNYLLEPLGYQPKVHNNMFMILTAYLANLGIPRSGEFLRATELATYENVPFETGFGTIVSERIIDVVMLLAIILMALLFQTDLILGFMNESGFGIYGGLLILLIGIVGLFVTVRLIKNSSSGAAQKLKVFLTNMLDAILSIFKMKRKWPFIFHTLFIWFAYVAMFWAIKYTMPSTVDLELGPILVAFVGGAIAMTTTNGGFIAYPLFVGTSLQLFGLDLDKAQAFGWIMWIAQTLMIVVFGAISFLLLPLLNRNQKS